MKKTLFSILLTLLPVTILADYDVNFERTFDGTVVSVPHMFDRIMYFSLKTGNRVIEVQLGPKDFVANSKLKLKGGDTVTAVGVLALLGKQEVLLAREVRTANTILTVRDRNGEPMWNLDRPVQMDTDFDTGEEEMCEMIDP